MTDKSLIPSEGSLPDDEALDRMLAGEASPAEAAAVSEWLASHVYAAPLVRRFIGTLAGDHVFECRDPELSFEVLKEKLRPVLPADPHDTTLDVGKGSLSLSSRRVEERSPAWNVFKGQPLRRGVWSALAGTALIGLVFASWRTKDLHTAKSKQAAVSTYMTGNGQRATITLPDGNIVALNVASRLEVPVDYATGNHTLQLHGEALFTVNHHTGAPFTVMAGQTAARVLGTSFVMRRYPSDTVTMVAVQDGKVAVHATVLTAGRAAEIGAAGATRLEDAGSGVFSFASGILTLNNVPFAEAVPELDRWFNVDIRVGTPGVIPKGGGVTGQYTAGSLADLVDLLGWTFNARVVRNGRVLTLLPR